MFQYAYAMARAIKQTTTLKLDTSNYGSDPLRTYQLKYFNVTKRVALPSEIFWSKLLNKLKMSRNSYLEGFWQSEKHFINIENTVREEFKLKNPMDIESKSLADKIANDNAISIHVRRGDYITNTKLNKILQSLPSEYYEGAIKIITKKIGNPHFFIFSDDIKWAIENLKINYPVTYIPKSVMDCEALVLMSLCRHNIIANSSFSWWGAWLNKNNNKIVIAPQNWFTNSSKNTADLIPNSWIKV